MTNGGGAQRNPRGGWIRDLIRPPFRQYSIETDLSEAEVEERLRAIVEPGNVLLAGFSRTDKLFGGEVSSDGFKIVRLIYYGNSGLPLLIGRFEPGPTGTRILVTMRLMRFTQVFSAVWFGFVALFFLVIAIATVFSPRKTEGDALMMLGAVAMGAFGYLLILAGPFGLEARKAQGLLEEALQATPGPRIQKVLAGSPPRLSRLAKYLLGVGALSMLGVVVGIAVPHLMFRSVPYQIAESYIRSDPVIEDKLGRIHGVSLELTGNSVSWAGPEGNARFAFEVEGARGAGVVLVAMRKHRGIWDISTADLREPSGRIVSLRAETASETTAPSR